MLFPALLTLLAALARPAAAQSSGEFTVSVTDTTPGEGCILVAQIQTSVSPNVISGMIPICPASDTSSASSPTTVKWPIVPSGDGAGSNLAIYSKVRAVDGTSTAGCAMVLTQMQVMYALGRTLEWRSELQEMYDVDQKGYLSDPTTFAVLTWYVEGGEELMTVPYPIRFCLPVSISQTHMPRRPRMRHGSYPSLSKLTPDQHPSDPLRMKLRRLVYL
jgi:hypothetical protein